MDAQSTNASLVGRQRGIDWCLNSGVERFSAVDDGELQANIVRSSLNSHITRLSWRIGIFHHIDNSLFYSHLYISSNVGVEAQRLTHLLDKSIQSRHLLRVVW